MVLKLLTAIFHPVKPEDKDNTAEKRVRDEESQGLEYKYEHLDQTGPEARYAWTL